MFPSLPLKYGLGLRVAKNNGDTRQLHGCSIRILCEPVKRKINEEQNNELYFFTFFFFFSHHQSVAGVKVIPVNRIVPLAAAAVPTYHNIAASIFFRTRACSHAGCAPSPPCARIVQRCSLCSAMCFYVVIIIMCSSSSTSSLFHYTTVQHSPRAGKQVNTVYTQASHQMSVCDREKPYYTIRVLYIIYIDYTVYTHWYILLYYNITSLVARQHCSLLRALAEHLVGPRSTTMHGDANQTLNSSRLAGIHVISIQ